jgi:hypothetical protein
MMMMMMMMMMRVMLIVVMVVVVSVSVAIRVDAYVASVPAPRSTTFRGQVQQRYSDYDRLQVLQQQQRCYNQNHIPRTSITQLHMNLFDRFQRVAKSNLNNILQGLEDPEKIMTQALEDMQVRYFILVGGDSISYSQMPCPRCL